MSDQSPLIPSDQFDRLLSRLIGLPDGAHTQPHVVQAIDFYGNTTSYMVQTVRTEDGPTAFVTQVNAAGAARFILPPTVLKLIDRQRDTMTKIIRRRHGRRLAESRPAGSPFTPEMRRKALATRRAKAAARKAKRG